MSRLLLLALAVAGFAAVATAGDSSRLLLVGPTVIRVGEGETIRSATVVVEGDKIKAILFDDAYKARPGDRVVDCRGMFVMPGLADMQVRLDDPVDLAVFVAHGVTTVRVVHGSRRTLALRREVRQGRLLGPSIIVGSPAIDGGRPRPAGYPGYLAKDDPETARKMVRRFKRAGYDAVSVGSDLPKESYLAVLDEAKNVNLPVWGPVPVGVGLAAAMRGGHRSVESMSGWGSALTADNDALKNLSRPARRNALGSVARMDHLVEPLVRIAGQQTVFHAPTLMAWRATGYSPREIAATQLGLVSRIKESMWRQGRHAHWQGSEERREWWLARERKSADVMGRIVRELVREGAPILAGSGYGIPFLVPGVSLHDELAELVKAGLTTKEALKAATVSPARLMGEAGAFGRIVEGANADLVVLAANPFDRISAVRQVNAVVIRGRLLTRESLARELVRVRLEQADFDPFRGLGKLSDWPNPLHRGEFLRWEGEPDDSVRGVTGGERFVVARVNGTIRLHAQVVYSVPPGFHCETRASLTDQWEVKSVVVRVSSAWQSVEIRGKRAGSSFEVSVVPENGTPENHSFPAAETTALWFPSVLAYACDLNRFREAFKEKGHVELDQLTLGVDGLQRVRVIKKRVVYRRVSAPRFAIPVERVGTWVSISFPDLPAILRSPGLLALSPDGWPEYYGIQGPDSEYKGRFHVDLRKRTAD